MATILFDGRDAYRKGGTGIATYARLLGILARKLGFDTQQVVSSEYPPDKKDPVLNEIRFHDVPGKRLTISQLVKVGWRASLGGFSDIRPTKVLNTGAVVDPTPESKKAFASTFASFKLFLIGEALYRVHGRRAVMQFDRTPDIFHATSPVPLQVRGAANLYTIHDIIPIRLPYTSLTNKKFFYNLTKELCAKADHIITVSEFSRRDIIKLTGISEDRITNTHQSVSMPQHLLSRSDDAVAADLAHIFELDMDGYFLFFGAIEPKKNVSRLIDGYLASGSKRPLVIAGGLGWQFEGDVKRMQDERFLSYRVTGERIAAERMVRHVDHVPFDQLVSLIRGARALIFPSLYEGFGLPVLEAMLLGTPVITSNVSSLPEIAGNAALLVDPMDVASIARAVRTLDKDSDLCLDLTERGRIQASKFSVERYETNMAALYARFAS
ncbi:glycosyltransferase family 4 protein [Lichenihabitans psoromatis]|uniref:glycosyltransferase family 4 protein n=1 Tax=Lichenihabitans psoromatis TaxID=2528642 RepID=UPI0010383591|nr:glycosyltransferase family 1 protein [Lichenihabitans psoromatis]